VAGFLTADSDSGRQLSVAGPAPSGQVAPPPAIDAPREPAPALEPATTTTIAQQLPQSPRVDAVPERAAPVTPPVDDPVVRSATTTTAAAKVIASEVPPPTTVPPGVDCTTADIKLTYGLEKDTYRSGEVVRGSTALERQPGVVCALPYFSEFQLVDSAGKSLFEGGMPGETATSSSDGSDGGVPFVKSSFAWEALDCSAQRLSPLVLAPGDRTGCVSYPAGTYTVVARWSGSDLSARMTFRLTF
jgi:hypothetical protein